MNDFALHIIILGIAIVIVSIGNIFNASSIRDLKKQLNSK